MRNREKALELDPANLFTLRMMAITYLKWRRFDKVAAACDRADALDPQNPRSRLDRAYWVDLRGRADTKPLHEVFEAWMTENPNAAAEDGEAWIELALCERDRAQAERALVILQNGYDVNGLHFSRTLLEACVARAFGDDAEARKAFTAARAEVERTVGEQPDNGAPLCVLGLIDAGLGRKEEAIREGHRASELIAKDAVNGALIMQYLGVIYAWTGEKDLAIKQIVATLQVPSLLSYGELRLHPFWNPLRGDPRFEKLVEEAKKPIALK
jgi:tetratricopeptide (TPR) repeat protein